MAANKFRKEIAFTFSDKEGIPYEVLARPTLAKMSAIESQFGPAQMLLRKFGAREVAMSDVGNMVMIMVNGVPGAPRPNDVPEEVFAHGPVTFMPSCVDFIIEGISVPDAAKPVDEGNG